MGPMPLAIATLMYILTVIDLCFYRGNVSMGLVFAGYAFSNCALIWLAYF